MTLTLLEQARNSEDTKRRAVIRSIVERTPMLERIPWMTINGNAYSWRSEVALPGIAFRRIGDTWPHSEGSTTQNAERLVIMGGEVKIDRFLIATQGGTGNLKAQQYDMKSRALALAFSEAFFEGDAASNVAQFDGLRTRISGNQLLEAGANGAALTLDMLDILGDTVLSTNKTELFTNKTLRRKLTSLGRNTSGHALIDVGTDVFGRQVTQYNGMPIRIIEREDTEATFLGFDETQGSSNVTASVYALDFGTDRLFGIQGKGGSLEVKDFGELEAAPQHMGRIEWYCNIVLMNPRAAVRLKGILNS